VQALRQELVLPTHGNEVAGSVQTMFAVQSLQVSRQAGRQGGRVAGRRQVHIALMQLVAIAHTSTPIPIVLLTAVGNACLPGLLLHCT